MSTVESPRREGSKLVLLVPKWEDHAESSIYQCRIILCPETEGGFSAHATRLPGVVSEGDTEVDAISNVKEAFRMAIKAYRDSGQTVPWENVQIDLCPGASERWIAVDV